MPLYNDEAVLLRSWDLGEADRIISFLGRRRGRVRVVAKGARKLKSRFSGRLEPFNKLSIVYYGKESTQLFKLSSIEIATPLRGISDDLEKYTHACYLSEVAEAAMHEGDPNPKAFDILLDALKWISKENRPDALEWAVRFFDVKFLTAIGYHPTLDRCITCGRRFEEKGNPLFHPEKGGISCHRCSSTADGGMELTIGGVKFLSKIISSSFGQGARLRPSAAMMKEITGAITAFRNARLGVKIKSEKYFNL